MEITVKSGAAEKQRTACLVCAVFEEAALPAATAAIDEASGGHISTLLKHGDLKGEVGQSLMLYDVPGVNAPRVLLLGAGKKADFNAKTLRKLAEAAFNTLKKSGAADALICFGDLGASEDDETRHLYTAALAMHNAHYRFTLHSADKKSPADKLKKIVFSISGRATKAVTGAMERAAAVSAGMCLTRDLGNLAPNICNPEYLAEQAKTLAKEYKSIKTTVLDERRMKTLGMGSLLAVAQGSEQPPRLIAMEYTGAAKSRKPVVLVGKGVTFDSGGISIKPSASMDEMKYDMCGAASVFGVMRAVAELGLPLNVVGIVPSVENMPSGTATRPGDVVTSLSGKTIEVLNTDAEGRLILCDALSYAEKYKPEAVIDIATLTGACIVALGHHTAGVMGNDDALIGELREAGDKALDPCWQLPMGDEYKDQLKSNFADMANIGTPGAGTITAACFLSNFTEDYRWAHLDIAGVAWKSGAAKGATGRPVPLLMEYLFAQAG
ncbi:leucyl aminopeptidase [Granulosicoccaceae sp. 1_MG-2023]|nr:leucyl aminopeptidase [Granulosicoccaceae sp. 1_MG-2023]